MAEIDEETGLTGLTAVGFQGAAEAVPGWDTPRGGQAGGKGF